ncbi:hypothetical protein I4U23_008851 [Adineta vaga]|nr:hypothetical protein I4U23_008851 [Adineta vaga]
MVLTATKQIEQSVLLNDVENVSILGIEQGCILLFSATSRSLSRNSTTLRTLIGGVQLSDGDQKIYYRHSSSVKITHASLNSARTLCCFVTRTESSTYDAYVAEIGLLNSGRLFSLRFSRPSPIRAYIASHDVILILYRDAITLFRMPNSGGNSMDKSVAVDKEAQLNECVYYQWDTIQQRLHVIQKRSSNSIKTISPNGYESLLYTAYIINSKGQFDSIMKVQFDLKLPTVPSSQPSFEIISNDSSLYLCWQGVIQEDSDKVEYAVVSLGHGRSLYISKTLNRDSREIFQSRKVHFGLLEGDYVFSVLRGEFVHLLNFNVRLNFVNHLFFPHDGISLPYDTKYTTQRGLLNRTTTLLYEKKNLFTYSIEINAEELIKTISSSTIESTIAYTLVASKDNDMLAHILEKILFHMYNDLNTKAYLKEILTGLIFTRLSKRIHHDKYVLVFPATTVNTRHANHTDIVIQPFAHHREHGPEPSGTTNIDKEYYDKLRSSFDLSRRYRHKVSYSHPIMTSTDDNDFNNDITNEFTSNRRSSAGTTASLPIPTTRRSSTIRFFSFERQRKSSSSNSITLNTNDNPKSMLLLDAKNENLFNNVSLELQQLHPSWEQGRIKELAYEYVQATQIQCNRLIELFTQLAGYKSKQPLSDDDHESSSEKYKTLLVIIEKIYIAVVELGFSPTDELQRTLLEMSFRVLSFDRFIMAIDQNILTLTEEFVERVILELDNDSKSYAMKEQLILMLPNTNSDTHSRLFSMIKNDRAKRTTAQLLVARSFSLDNRNRSLKTSYINATLHEIQVDEMMNVNNNENGTNTQSRIVKEAAVTFFRDCNQRGILDEDEMSLIKNGLISLASSAP